MLKTKIPNTILIFTSKDTKKTIIKAKKKSKMKRRSPKSRKNYLKLKIDMQSHLVRWPFSMSGERSLEMEEETRDLVWMSLRRYNRKLVKKKLIM